MPKLPKKLSIGEETLALPLRANGIDGAKNGAPFPSMVVIFRGSKA